jgi:hypothetical protein
LLGALKDLLISAVETTTSHTETIALNLTGGFDTRLILSAVMSLGGGKRVLAFTNGRKEMPFVEPILNAVDVEHYCNDWTHEASQVDDIGRLMHRLALLTDGEADCLSSSKGLLYWGRNGELAPGGVLHGALGEAWRAFYYQTAYPTRFQRRLRPMSYLLWRLTFGRRRLQSLLAPEWSVKAKAFLKDDVAKVWDLMKRTHGYDCAIDAFYILERQRGLHSVLRCSDQYQHNLMPLGNSRFLERALPFTGVQGRCERLHRSIIAMNSKALPTFPTDSGGNCVLLRGVARATKPYTALIRRILPDRTPPAGSTKQSVDAGNSQIIEMLRSSDWKTAEFYDMQKVRDLLGHSASLRIGSSDGLGNILSAELASRIADA